MEMNKDMVTALVDGEVTDASFKKEIFSTIESDKDFANEYKVQSFIKNLVKEKVVIQNTPDKVRVKIIRSIGSDTKKISAKKYFLSDLFEKPSFSFATAFVVVLAVVLIILNRPGTIEKKDFAIEQMGNDNMFVQAKNNFNSILEGRLVPQLRSTSPEEIKKFFGDSGVKYMTMVPSIAEWSLLGAVVTDYKSKKFAHHLYIGKKGELAYLFQVDESYLYEHEIISLSDDLIKYLDEGNCYYYESEGTVKLFTKMDNNICAIVSNGNPKELENTFCSH
jgi:hypothetical protein